MMNRTRRIFVIGLLAAICCGLEMLSRSSRSGTEFSFLEYLVELSVICAGVAALYLLKGEQDLSARSYKVNSAWRVIAILTSAIIVILGGALLVTRQELIVSRRIAETGGAMLRVNIKNYNRPVYFPKGTTEDQVTGTFKAIRNEL